MGTLKNNYQKSIPEILIEFGTILVGIFALLSAYLPRVFGNSDPLLAMFLAGLVAICIPALQKITKMIFGIELTEKLEDKESVIKELREENLDLKIANSITKDRLVSEQEVTEWKLKAMATNDKVRESIISNAEWNTTNSKLEELE